jgi:hypothetical protein
MRAATHSYTSALLRCAARNQLTPTMAGKSMLPPTSQAAMQIGQAWLIQELLAPDS